MARPDKIDHPWAGDGGDVTPAPSDDKRDVGFVNGDRPYKQYFNRIMLECQEGLNNVITEGPGSWYPDASNINTMLMTGQWDEAWGQIGGAVNTIEGGTHEWTDTCLYFDSDNVAYILVSDIYSVGEGSIKAYNTRTGALTATSNLLADDLPSGGTEKWEAQSMCCDGVNVYVVLTDTDATPDEHIIQAWTVDLESSNWATPWGGTGTSLSGTGNGLDAGSRDAQVIIADDDHIAVSCGWIDITAAGDAAIQLFLRSDGSAVRDGSGDCTTGASYQPIEGICSDGTNIFFVAYDDTSETLICSATIADLTAGCGGANFPKNCPDMAGSVVKGRHMVCLGVGGPIVTVVDHSGGYRNDQVILLVSDSSDADLMEIERGDFDGGAIGDEGEDYFWRHVLDLAYDGQNIWILTDSDDGTTITLNLIKIDVAKLAQIAQTDNAFVPNLTSCLFKVLPDRAFDAAAAAGRKYTSMLFDGRDIWIIPEPRAGVTNTGKIVRFPNAIYRN